MKKLTLLALPLIALLGLGTLQSRSLRDFLFNALNPFPDSLALTAPAAVPLPPPATKPFPVFDATLYKNKPSLTSYGFVPLRIVYESDMWKKGTDMQSLPSQTMIRDASRTLGAAGSLAVIDIEHWALQNANGLEINNSLAKYRQTVAWFRQYAPGVKLGYYSMVPLRNYWGSLNLGQPNARFAWQTDNNKVQSLADAVDVIYPSLYTFYTDKSQWVQYAISNIAEARRMAKGKPVYAFLWPQYHESNRILGLTYLPADYWKLQLETVKKYADGVVIWGGWDLVALQKGKPGGPLPWDGNAAWWNVTKNFLATLKTR